MRVLIFLLFLLSCSDTPKTPEQYRKLYVISHIDGPELVKGEEGMCMYIYWSHGVNMYPQWDEIMDSCGKHDIGDTIIIKSK